MAIARHPELEEELRMRDKTEHDLAGRSAMPPA
jgi:hypothetical protein